MSNSVVAPTWVCFCLSRLVLREGASQLGVSRTRPTPSIRRAEAELRSVATLQRRLRDDVVAEYLERMLNLHKSVWLPFDRGLSVKVGSYRRLKGFIVIRVLEDIDHGLGGQAVAKGIAARAGFSFRRLWSGACTRVALIGLDLLKRCHAPPHSRLDLSCRHFRAYARLA